MTTAPSTLAQKLVARAAGRAHVTPGEFVTCAVDLAMFHDSSGPRRLQPMLAELGAEIWDKQKVVLVIDHYVPEADDESRRIVRIARACLAGAGAPDIDPAPWHSDADAPGQRHHFDASTLAPQVALPHSPANARAVTELARTPIQVAYLGACTSAMPSTSACCWPARRPA